MWSAIRLSADRGRSAAFGSGVSRACGLDRGRFAGCVLAFGSSCVRVCGLARGVSSSKDSCSGASSAGDESLFSEPSSDWWLPPGERNTSLSEPPESVSDGTGSVGSPGSILGGSTVVGGVVFSSSGS